MKNKIFNFCVYFTLFCLITTQDMDIINKFFIEKGIEYKFDITKDQFCELLEYTMKDSLNIQESDKGIFTGICKEHSANIPYNFSKSLIRDYVKRDDLFIKIVNAFVKSRHNEKDAAFFEAEMEKNKQKDLL